MTIFFTADSHFGHYNILKYCNRPFSSIREHDSTLIDNWNSKVKSKDIVYHLGDFSMKRFLRNKILPKLNGKIHLIRGNHDRKLKSDEKFASISEYAEIKIDKKTVVLFHYPIESWNRRIHGTIHLHGHSHGNLQNRIPRRLDVGVDNHDFFPISWPEVLVLLEEEN